MNFIRILVISILIIFSAAQNAHALILINEFLADPPAGAAGDANQDGTTSSSQDEFIELVNTSNSAINLLGWSVDDGIGLRHEFQQDAFIEPYGFYVIFGGGSPRVLKFPWITASSGALGLNNGGDTISLYDDTAILRDSYVYGSEGGDNQSLTRFPDGMPNDFLRHSQIPSAQGRIYSPGTTVDGQTNIFHVVPEPKTVLLVLLGIILFIGNKKNLITQPKRGAK